MIKPKNGIVVGVVAQIEHDCPRGCGRRAKGLGTAEVLPTGNGIVLFAREVSDNPCESCQQADREKARKTRRDQRKRQRFATHRPVPREVRFTPKVLR